MEWRDDGTGTWVSYGRAAAKQALRKQTVTLVRGLLWLYENSMNAMHMCHCVDMGQLHSGMVSVMRR